MISGSLAAPTPLRDGIREEQGDDESEAQSQSQIVPLVNAANLAYPSVPRRDWRILIAAMAAVSDRKMC